MARFFFGMNQSLDGFVDHDRFPYAPGPVLYRRFVDQTQNLAGSLYGRRLYETMRYWDEDQPGWDAEKRAFAAAWRKNPKWVVSRTLKAVGPNARLLGTETEAEIRRLKVELEGEVEVGGPELARCLTEWGLIDEYRIYLHPVVLGHGTPFFASPRPPLRLIDTERFDGDVIRLSYVPA
ncbi:dihydrofolate reductase family protein [Aminobacter carboxidus]|uniref:Dihydrofolate reductase n=1 Tax=Aminobacter carboxidus TaxID=376165 RepID=A0A8E2BFJ9_9HYPH|nr:MULTISPECIES: dihydrofolate reductase family protein [Aminobacter carboxidus group]MBB6469569.1 dihydrofolate reductase [Aminobacter lissarensis]MBE1208480.1 dihydrofolate reductase family protein [Aminobacter carboxidus]